MDETQTENVAETPSVKQTKEQIFWEIIRFLVVGGTATVFDYAAAYLFQTWLLPSSVIGEAWTLVISTAVGFTVGLIVNWLLSITFVFKAVKNKAESRSKKAFLKFALIGVIGLFVSIAGMQLVRILPSIELLGVETFLKESWTWWLMKCVMTGVVLVWNYLGRKLFVFKN